MPPVETHRENGSYYCYFYSFNDTNRLVCTWLNPHAPCGDKLRSNNLSFHRFGPRSALFPVVRTRRIDVARRLVSTSVVSRVVEVNSSHIKGADGAIASIHSSAAEKFAKPRSVVAARQFEFHRPQSKSANLERLEDWPLEQVFRERAVS
ncbi:hypothetical protein AVEN_158519-1 [Araneus ventricosus]|uniref:Uncharacterized protein n=1 Tax=Araneus ventricosus TaxID=182803 RepID=A0A4Y1ZSD9_ARAVE|nr:hypothetical protein AVEN_158519-1 [Araneus ventricosus]